MVDLPTSRFSNILFAVADPDFQIRGGGWLVIQDLQIRGGGGGGGGAGAGHPDPEIRGGAGSQKNFLGPSGLSLV